MSMFNSLSYATKLVDAGVPREQAEVHAQVLQGVYEQEHEQYATKADFILMRNEVSAHIAKLEVNTARLDNITAEISSLKTMMDGCKNEFTTLRTEFTTLRNEFTTVRTEFSTLRTDIATLTSSNQVLTNSHKYILWIGGGLATMCVSVLGLCVPVLLHNMK